MTSAAHPLPGQPPRVLHDGPAAATLPHDPALPRLRLALDGDLMGTHWAGYIDAGRWALRGCRVDRVKYRPGHNLAVSYRLALQDNASGAVMEQIVAARFCAGGDGARRAAKAAARLDAASGGSECRSFAGPALTHDAALDMVAHWWPNDAKLAASRSLAPAQAAQMAETWLPEVLAATGERGRVRAGLCHHALDLVQVVPEHRFTVRASMTTADGRALRVYGKADAALPGPRTHAVMAALWCSTAQREGRLSTPRPLLWQPASGLHWQAELPGRPLVDAGAPGTGAAGQATSRPASGTPGAIGPADAFAAGRLVAALHGTRTLAEPLDGDHLRHRPLQVAAILTPVLPALAQRLQRLAMTLARPPAGLPAPVTLHGDLHPGNLLRDDAGGLHLIDLDGARQGPAQLDLGDWAAEAFYRALWLDLPPAVALASVQSFMDGYARTGATRPRAADLAWATAWQLLCRRLWRCCVNLKPGRFALVAPLLSLAETLAAQGHVEAASPAPRGRTGPPLSAPRAVQ